MKLRHVVLAVAALIILVPLAIAYTLLRASLPKLDGDFHNLEVVAAVSIDRDELGVPTLEAANRADLAYGLGFVHGQDRFFEMDLSRRLAAGELSELFGTIAVDQDRKARLFRFRAVARAAFQHSSPEEHAIVEAYARGVNAGLGSLHSRPWEYWLLRSMPVDWRPEDTILVTHAMWWDLQYGGIDREIQRRQINSRMSGPDCEGGWKCSLKFLYSLGTEWDAPDAPVGVINVGPDANAPVPPPEILNVRGSATAAAGAPVALVPNRAPDSGIGSNNWVVAGKLTSTGSALVANDMHLRARVPIVWYRARMRLKATASKAAIDLNGVTLPGAPVLVAGSNGHIAWGFTNSYGNWMHVEEAPCSQGTSVQHEEIQVHDAPSVDFAVISGPAGMLYRTDPDGQSCWFVSWLVQQAGATNINLMELERADSVSQALEIAPTLGIPHQNLVVGDHDGHIAWTIAGRIPADSGPSRATGQPSWIAADSQPRIVDPEIGRIWTANGRVTDDPAQQVTIAGVNAAIGSDYDLSARVHQIRDDLLAIKGPATPADMLHIQLDDRAVFLTRWHDLLLQLLDADAVANQPQRARFRQLVENWDAHASADSVGYRLVRSYHDQTQKAVWEMLLAALEVKSDQILWSPAQFEGALWRLVTERPLHMLAANHSDWRQFLLAQVDATLAELSLQCPQLEHCTWGQHNPVRIRHPLSRAVPVLAHFLDMPTLELAGDHDMPRVQDGDTGASERFAVSPGHEDQGYIHIPGGQSGHPLSPYYRAGFSNWAQGVPAPFLPGPALHKLTLESQ
jgi:penicillin G amidase